jgi:hypothetical protein
MIPSPNGGLDVGTLLELDLVAVLVPTSSLEALASCEVVVASP